MEIEYRLTAKEVEEAIESYIHSRHKVRVTKGSLQIGEDGVTIRATPRPPSSNIDGF
jgi:hypothetical protein